ncbi:MAG: alternate ATPase, subunit gamma [Gammaproteobacteria bacterium]|nr:alternate ATPase, subunit gamma [Gammaproteobacteria bacterium]
MSGVSEELGRKISGARDLQSIVRSMKALAASNIGQYERAVAALHEYYRIVELAVRACSRVVTSVSLPKAPAGPDSVGAVIFGSDLGLVGRFNEVLAEFATHTLSSQPGRTARIWAVGERMEALIAGPTRLFPVPNSVDHIGSLVGEILIDVAAAQEAAEVREVYVFHNAPQAAALYAPVVRRLLPLDAHWQTEIGAIHWPTPRVPEVIQGAAPALAAFIREYLFILLFQACAESLASESATRLAAMQRAEKNIEDMLDEMNRRFHRIRQQSIDEELFEVVSGYDSLARA